MGGAALAQTQSVPKETVHPKNLYSHIFGRKTARQDEFDIKGDR